MSGAVVLGVLLGVIVVGTVPALVAWARGIPTGTRGAFARSCRPASSEDEAGA